MKRSKSDSSDELLHYGIKGMKWGVRRSRSELARARGENHIESRRERKKAAKSSSRSASGRAPSEGPPDESAGDRYLRLKAHAAKYGANSLSETDLKFVNARTDAIKKVNELNKRSPGWLGPTTKKVLLKTAERQLQSVVDGAADKYISGPILQSMKKADSQPAKKKKN